MATALAAPFRFFSLQVVRTRRLGPSLVRVSFTGEELRHFLSDGRDQSLSLFLPAEGRSEPGVPVELGDGWWQAWRETPDDVRAVMRSYTLRSLRRNPDEIDIDFVLHEPAGPASRWASRARAGDRVQLLGPAVADNRAIRFRPPEDTDLVLLWGDATALPAVSAILETLPAGRRARVWLEVHDAGDIQELPTEADADITWLTAEETGDGSRHRPESAGGAPVGGDPVGGDPVGDAPVGGAPAPMALEALRAAPLPASERPYVWIAGESGCVKELRRHFVRERGVDRRRVTFVGYWRQGMTEEQLREAGE